MKPVCWFLLKILGAAQTLTLPWTTSSEFGTYRLCEQQRFRQACASAQSRQNLRCSLIQAMSQKEPSDRKPDPWPLWMAGHALLKFVMTECSKTQIRLTGLTLMLLTTCNAVPYSSAVPYNIDLNWMACPVDSTHNIIHLSQNCFPAADSFSWAISTVDLPLVWHL